MSKIMPRNFLKFNLKKVTLVGFFLLVLGGAFCLFWTKYYPVRDFESCQKAGYSVLCPGCFGCPCYCQTLWGQKFYQNLDEPSPGFSNEIKEVAGLVVRVVTPSEGGPLDTPKKFSFFIATDDGDEIEVYYFAYPPEAPVEGVLYDRPTIEFYQEPVSVGDYLTAQGIYDKEKKTLFVEEQSDYLKTYSKKP